MSSNISLEELQELASRSFAEEQFVKPLDKAKAIVVEDQAVLWEYIASCLEPYYEVVAFCSNTTEAEIAFREHKPDLVWLDCYLGEFSDISQGVKNSGIDLALWVKNHSPQTKIFLFTASNELGILNRAHEIGIEGIALGGKFLKNKDVIRSGVAAVSYGAKWVSPNIIEDIELGEIANITVFEFCVIFSLLVGKSSLQIAEEFDTTRKRVNNSVYRVKQKLNLDDDTSKDEMLEIFKEKINHCVDPNHFYNLSELISVNAVVEQCLSPLIDEIKSGKLSRVRLSQV